MEGKGHLLRNVGPVLFFTYAISLRGTVTFIMQHCDGSGFTRWPCSKMSLKINSSGQMNALGAQWKKVLLYHPALWGGLYPPQC